MTVPRLSAARRLLVQLSAEPAPRVTDVRVSVVVAHPDDEVIGVGSRLAALQQLSLVQITDGAPRNLGDVRAAGHTTCAEYARARRAERQCALAIAGHADACVRDLGIPDQEAGAALVPITRQLVDIFTAIAPDVVITHPYEGGHPDHDATAFAVHAAVRLMHAVVRDRTDSGSPAPPLAHAPDVVEMTSYHERDGGMTIGCFPPDGHAADVTVALGPESCAMKQRMYDCYATQRHVLAGFPIGAESFRIAPAYDFSRLPRGGPLYYEHFDWGMRAEQWLSLSTAALRELGLLAGDIASDIEPRRRHAG